jgi:general secretion pathway protein G
MRGYTLLELLLVLALIGLVAGIAVPRVTTLYESFKWAMGRDEALRNIAELGYKAYKQNRAFDLVMYPVHDEGVANFPLNLPDGWQITADKPIHYRSNGICDGGTLQLYFGDRILDVVLTPPHCNPEII